jgi:hypothetical protein
VCEFYSAIGRDCGSNEPPHYLLKELPMFIFTIIFSVARWQKFRPKSSTGAAEKKKLAERICGRILADFTKYWQKRGRRKFSKEVPYF